MAANPDAVHKVITNTSSTECSNAPTESAHAHAAVAFTAKSRSHTEQSSD
jgi:hypothetical protein